MKDNKIFFIITEEGRIIFGNNVHKLSGNEQIVYESDIDELVEIEMSENSHYGDCTDLEFALSDAKKESYKEFIKYSKDIRHYEALNIIQNEVIRRIKDSLL